MRYGNENGANPSPAASRTCRRASGKGPGGEVHLAFLRDGGFPLSSWLYHANCRVHASIQVRPRVAYIWNHRRSQLRWTEIQNLGESK